jgi:5-methylcytosine-specific restriction endonuclease McrA
MNCLLLNSNYEPISILPLSIINWQHAIKLMFLDRITVLEEYEDHVARSASLTIHYPAVAVTKNYFNNKKGVRFSRANLYLRDLYQCQYCGDTFDNNELTIDHMIPKASGGKVNWENAVTACKPCNHKKGTKLWKPMNMPYKPDYYQLVNKWKGRPVHIQHSTWYQYLGIDEKQQANQ